MARLICLALVLLSGTASALSFSYDVILENKLDSRVHLTLRQYHAGGFDGTRPSAWSDDLLSHSTDGSLVPGQVETVIFSDAVGGFWVVWSASDSASGNLLCEGEVDFTRGKSPFRVELNAMACKFPR